MTETAPTSDTETPSTSSTTEPDPGTTSDPPDGTTTDEPETSTTRTTNLLESSGGGPACDPLISGEWNSCVDEMGMTDNTLCNWTGNPDATGFLSCLTSSEMKGYNTCFIRDCEDTCDCFSTPPATGTAVVGCAEILAKGGTGCFLDCSGGATCPDGMECIGNTCFWPPPA